jgi:cupin superfamily acireductone dioxygenase involved in methionine salvage
MTSQHQDSFNAQESIKVYKWPHQTTPTAENVKEEMKKFGFLAYDLQTIPPWFERSAHAHDYDEIRGAVSGCTTFHFDNIPYPITLEAGDIVLIPKGTVHRVQSHNGNPFTAYKGNTLGVRSVTEHGDGKGSLEDLNKKSTGTTN